MQAEDSMLNASLNFTHTMFGVHFSLPPFSKFVGNNTKRYSCKVDILNLHPLVIPIVQCKFMFKRNFYEYITFSMFYSNRYLPLS